MARTVKPGNDLLDEMQSRASRTPPAGGSFKVTRKEGDFELVFHVVDADRLGVLVEEIEMLRRRGASAPEDLDRQTRSLMSAVTSLGDRFALIEIEPRLERAVLRSATPRILPEGLEYDEIVLEGGSRASLRRHRFSRESGKREAVPANLAAEVVPRLARELWEAFRS